MCVYVYIILFILFTGFCVFLYMPAADQTQPDRGERPQTRIVQNLQFQAFGRLAKFGYMRLAANTVKQGLCFN